jgi:hypothetical protein
LANLSHGVRRDEEDAVWAASDASVLRKRLDGRAKQGRSDPNALEPAVVGAVGRKLGRGNGCAMRRSQRRDMDGDAAIDAEAENERRKPDDDEGE